MRKKTDEQPTTEVDAGTDNTEANAAPVVGSGDTDNGDDGNDAPAGTSTDFKLAEKRDNELVLQTEDGRMFTAQLAEGVEPDVLKSSTITISHDGIVDGVPTNPVVTSIDR